MTFSVDWLILSNFSGRMWSQNVAALEIAPQCAIRETVFITVNLIHRNSRPHEKSLLLCNLCLVFMAVKCPLGGAVAFLLFSVLLARRGFIFCFGKPH